MSLSERLKFGPYLTVYNKDYVKKKIESPKRFVGSQEFKDPICEGFREFLTLEKGDDVVPPSEACDDYAEKFQKDHPKIAEMYFEKPLDKITIKGERILNGKSVYQVDYCDIEAEIRRKLLESKKTNYELPEGWEIPLTTQRYDFRAPLTLSEHAMDKPMVFKPVDNLGQDEKINAILEVKTGDSEYNKVIGKLGDFIVNEQMHGKIVHPNCDCFQHQQTK